MRNRHLLALSLMTALTAAHAACPDAAEIEALAKSYAAKTPAKAFAADLSMSDAQCARDKLVTALQGNYGKVIGYKAGLTNPAVQQRFGHAAPVRGVLLEKMLLKSGATVPAAFGARPLFEADLVVEVADERVNDAKTPLDVARALINVYPFIELPDLVLDPQVKMNGPLITAVNVGARLGVLGAPIAVQADDTFVASLASMDVVMSDASGEIDKGKGAAILEHPLNAVIWLAQDLKASGNKLRKGDLLSLGSFTKLVPPKAGQRVTVIYKGLPGDPSVSVNFE